jgi:hypothetical protein
MLLVLGRPGTSTLTIPGCPTPVTLDVRGKINVRGRADINGDEVFTVDMPSGLNGRTVVSQAISQVKCEVSNAVTTTFN